MKACVGTLALALCAAPAVGAAQQKPVAGLKESFQFCSTALGSIQDAQLGDSVPFFGGRKVTRGVAVLVTVADWADHYSQLAIYLRLNGHLPPTARRGM